MQPIDPSQKSFLDEIKGFNNTLDRGWLGRAVKGASEDSLSLGAISQAITDHMAELYYYTPNHRTMPTVEARTTLGTPLAALAANIDKVYKPSLEKNRVLNEIKEIQRVLTTDLSQEEFILTEIEFILGKDWPETFPRFIKDDRGRFLDPAGQLKQHREFVAHALLILNSSKTVEPYWPSLLQREAVLDIDISPHEYANLTKTAADRLFLVFAGEHLALNKENDRLLLFERYVIDLNHKEAERGREWLRMNDDSGSSALSLLFRGQFFPPEIAKFSQLQTIDAQFLAASPHPAVYKLKNLEILKTNVPWKFDEFPKLKELALDIYGAVWNDLPYTLNDVASLQKITVTPEVIPRLAEVLTEKSNIRTITIDYAPARPQQEHNFTSGEELVKFLRQNIPKQKMG